MRSPHYLLSIPATLIAVALGLAACSDEPTANGLASRQGAVPINLELSSLSAATGQRVAVAVRVDAAEGRVAGIQGALKFDATRLRYVGQSPAGSAVTIANHRGAERGELRFTSFSTNGISGQVALFVFEARGAGYSAALEYRHELAASTGARATRLGARVNAFVTRNASLAIPSDARFLSVADWSAMLGGGEQSTAVALRPGEYRENLRYGDVNYDNAIGLADYLGVANAVVGNNEIIVGTDGPAIDVDLVIAGNVAPAEAGLPCGTDLAGARNLDLFDYLAIANEAVGNNPPCAGDIIPGRAPRPTTIQSIAGADLIVGDVAGEVLTLTNDRIWQLEGTLDVRDGGSLIIQPGTIVQGNTAASATQAIFVQRGGQIFANGTQNQPVVFTCTAVPKFKGCWGGIFIAGRDSVNLGEAALGNSPDGCAQRQGEGNGPIYGGCNRNDNSGVIRYSIIEYGGKVVGANNELNGLTLGGVGSGTTIEYVQIRGGTDDGIEFFGGSVNVKYLVLTGNDDDGFDISFGYRGDAQFVVIQTDAGNATGTPDSKAIEADGNEPAPGAVLVPRTSPRLFNFTIVGNLATTQPAAIHLRRATGPSINNFLVIGHPIGLDIDDPLTCDAFGGTPPTIRSTTFIDVANLGNDDASDPTGGACPTPANPAEGEEAFINAEASNRTRSGVGSVLIDALNTDLPDWRMRLVGALPAEGGVVTPPAGSIFSTVAYRGAVPPAGTAGTIPWYAGWTRGFQGPTTP